MRAVGILGPEQFNLGDLNQIIALEALLRAQRFGREMLRVLDRLVQERLLLREPGVGPVRELAVEFVLTLIRSEEHTSELQSLMRISYAVFCLKKKNILNK